MPENEKLSQKKVYGLQNLLTSNKVCVFFELTKPHMCFRIAIIVFKQLLLHCIEAHQHGACRTLVHFVLKVSIKSISPNEVSLIGKQCQDELSITIEYCCLQLIIFY